MLAPQELNPEIPKPAKASVRGLGEILLRSAPRRSAALRGAPRPGRCKQRARATCKRKAWTRDLKLPKRLETVNLGEVLTLDATEDADTATKNANEEGAEAVVEAGDEAAEEVAEEEVAEEAAEVAEEEAAAEPTLDS